MTEVTNKLSIRAVKEKQNQPKAFTVVHSSNSCSGKGQKGVPSWFADRKQVLRRQREKKGLGETHSQSLGYSMMRVLIRCYPAILLLTGIGVSAFSPAHNVVRRTGTVGLGSSSTTRLHMVASSSSSSSRRRKKQKSPSPSFPNPLSKLPWNVSREKARETRRLKQEAALLYRELGVAEDATFEEIQEATATLLARYANDLKKKVKVEITKDKIMQIRLNQRLGGMVKETSDVAANSYLEEDAEDFGKQPINLQLPGWLQTLVVKPDQIWRDQCVLWFGAFAFLGILMPTQAEGLQKWSFLLSGALMGTRGTPKPEPGQGLFRTQKVGPHSFIGFGLALGAFMWWGFLTSLIMKSLSPVLDGSPFYFTLQNMLIAGFMGLTTAYLQPYKKK